MAKTNPIPISRVALVLAALAVVAGCSGHSSRFLLISIDTLRPDHLSCYGYERPTSPNIDALAKEGMLFRRAYAQAPYTLPSHMSMMTGLYPPAHGILYKKQRLPEERWTLAEVLKHQGFATAGITGGGFVSDRYGFGQGFDVYVEPNGSNRGFRQSYAWIAKWLRDHAADDFFLFIHTFDVHGSYFSLEPFQHRFREPERDEPPETMAHLRSIGQHAYLKLDEFDSLRHLVDAYDGGVNYVDAVLGELFSLLKELEIYDDTVIILVSDHGESFLDHGAHVGHGYLLYEEQVRVPLIIKLRKGDGVTGESRALVELVDLWPTILDLAGIPSPVASDGQSLARILRGQESSTRKTAAFGTSPNGSHQDGPQYFDYMVHHNGLKYISAIPEAQDDETPSFLRFFRPADPDAFLATFEHGEQVFDLQRDAKERHNLATARAGDLAQLREALATWRRRALEKFEAGPSAGEAVIDAEALRALGYMR